MKNRKVKREIAPSLMLTIILVGVMSLKINMVHADGALGIDVYDKTIVGGVVGGNINWPLVAQYGYEFAFVRATQGLGYPKPGDPDANFVTNMVNGKNAGLEMGAFHFAYPKNRPTLTGAEQEATFFYNVAKDYLNYGLPPVLDIEDEGAGIIDPTNSSGWAWLSGWANWWMLKFKNISGKTAFIYIDKNHATFMTGDITNYPLWAAYWSYDVNDPPTEPFGHWQSWSFWQFAWVRSTSESPIPGMSNYGLDMSKGGVGGFVVPIDKFGLLAPYIGLASTILVATVATAIYVKRVKPRKEKQ